jgi:hypothetical protein
LEAHEALLAALLPPVTCQICLDLLHKPFALAPCGHMACYSCLVSWFTTPPVNDNVQELPIHRKKTCPHCRAVVRDRPAEVWSVKEMVASVTKSGLAPHFPAPPPADAAPVPDPWVNIFPSLPHARGARAGEGDQADMGMYDAEDAVYRCLDCMHEIWEGSCAQCGRIYPGHDGADSADEDDVAHMVNALRNGLVNGFHPVLDLVESGSDEEDGGSEASYESSFIDDEGDVVLSDPHVLIDLTGGDEDEGPSDEEAHDASRLGHRWRSGSPAAVVDIEGEDDEDDDEGQTPAPRVRGRSAVRARIWDDDDEEDEIESDGS